MAKTPSKDLLTTSAYLQLKIKRGGNGAAQGLTPQKVTTHFPGSPLPDVAIVRLEIGIPAGALNPVVAVVDVPGEAVQVTAQVDVENSGGV